MKEKIKTGIGIVIIICLIILIGLIIYKAIRANSDKIINPIATFELEDYGTVKIELYPEYALNTVSNFVALINSGFYNNKVVYGKDDTSLYMARDTEDDTEGPKVSLIDDSIEADSDDDYKYEINGEFIANHFEQNTLRPEKGVIILNRSDYTSYGLKEESYNSGSSRFSVMMNENTDFNGVYCAFGKVIEGLDILEKIYNETEIVSTEPEEGEEGHNHEEEEHSHEEENAIQEFEGKPVISNASVDTNGIDFGKPEVHEAFDIQSYINKLYSQYIS